MKRTMIERLEMMVDVKEHEAIEKELRDMGYAITGFAGSSDGYGGGSVSLRAEREAHPGMPRFEPANRKE
jgi:hypothetical protein